MKKMIIALVAILVCLVIVAGVCIWIEFFREEPTPEADLPPASSSSEPSSTLPSASTEPSSSSSEASEILSTSSEPIETAPPTTTTQPTEPETTTEEENLPEVTTAEIEGSVSNSGGFTSNTGSGIELKVEWKTFNDDDGDLKVRLNISLSCYSIYVGSRYSGLEIDLGGSTKYLDTDAISYTGSGTTILIGSCVMDMPDSSVDAEVTWAYKGTYNGEQIDYITADGNIYG